MNEVDSPLWDGNCLTENTYAQALDVPGCEHIATNGPGDGTVRVSIYIYIHIHIATCTMEADKTDNTNARIISHENNGETNDNPHSYFDIYLRIQSREYRGSAARIWIRDAGSAWMGVCCSGGLFFLHVMSSELMLLPTSVRVLAHMFA